jgi:hypothetical protein
MDAASRQRPLHRRDGVASRLLAAPHIVAVLAWLAAGLAADARQVRPRPSLATIDGLTATQITTLQQTGIRSIASLAAASPATLTRALAIDLAAATRLVERAKGETARLRLVYSGERVRYPFSRTVGGSATPTAEEAYAQLITPTNECTILVRKVCGLQNQCASAPGCPLAKQLLDLYNTDTDTAPAAEACVASLEDGIVFPQCTTP